MLLFYVDDESYLVWKGSEEKAIALALPELNNLVTAQQFGVARKMMGSVLEPTPDDLHFNGTFYTPDNGLPYVSNIAEGTTLEVSANGKVYAYEAYEVAQIVKDAGVYVSVGFDGHRHNDYDGNAVYNMTKILHENGISTIENHPGLKKFFN